MSVGKEWKDIRLGRPRTRPIEDRFHEKVDKSPGHGPNGDCWIWVSVKPPNRYGLILFGKKQTLAHRVSYELANGPIPKGLWVLHRCDNPPCVNPDHLFLGTPTDNVQDCISKGRNSNGQRQRGEAHPKSKLKNEQVIEIRRLWEVGGITQLKLAAMFGVSNTTIRCIIARTMWHHV